MLKWHEQYPGLVDCNLYFTISPIPDLFELVTIVGVVDVDMARLTKVVGAVIPDTINSSQ